MNKYTSLFVLLAVIVLGAVYFAYNGSLNKAPVVAENTNGTRAPVVATVTSISIANVTSPASAVLAGAKNITWQTSNYPSGVGVNINLLKKVSDSPREFVNVRTIAKDTPNDGQESWTPKTGETGDDLYIEITCSSTYQFNAGCKLGGDVLKVN